MRKKKGIITHNSPKENKKVSFDFHGTLKSDEAVVPVEKEPTKEDKLAIFNEEMRKIQ